MKKNILTIKTISKFSLTYFFEGEKKNEDYLDLWYYFWNNIFSENPIYYWLKVNSNIFLDNIPKAKEIWKSIQKTRITSLELFYMYNILNESLNIINSILIDWNINLVRWITHKNSSFNSEIVDYNILEWGYAKFLIKILTEITSKIDFSDKKLIIFDLFWPGEIIQAIILTDLLKKKNPSLKVLLNFENANEQFDFESFINESIANGSYMYFRDIDFINFHRWNLLNFIDSYKNNWKIINILVNNWKEFFLNKLKSEEIELQDSFEKTLYNSWNSKKIFWKKYINIRMYPFKCYWGACFFCTINNWNENKFPHNNKEILKIYVDLVINYIRKEKIFYINFIDEAIYPDILEYFVDKVLEFWIKINYNFRTRFDKKFQDNNFLEKLYLSWARYCWIWLESASARVNLMFNKWDSLWIKEKLEIIKNFENKWISIHNYSIIWFPWETKGEILLTFKFLCNNIDKLKYYTCTPNIFGLMKGSYIYNNPNIFSIEIDQEKWKLIWDFTFKSEKRDWIFLRKITDNINKRQFTRYLDNINPRDFWEFIDRTWIFYYLKLIYKENPYLYPFKIIEWILSKWKKDLHKIKFKKTDFFSLYKGVKWENILFSFITYNSLILKKEEVDFLNNFNEDVNIWKNINLYHIWGDFLDFIIKNFIISNYEEDFRYIYN